MKNIVILALLSFLFITPGHGREDDFMFIFRHPAVGSYYVNAIYGNGQYYLPIGELFGLLCIHLEKTEKDSVLGGTFPGNSKYEIDPQELVIVSGRTRHKLEKADIYIGEMDLFLTPEVFETCFGLRFSIHLNTMGLVLQSDHPLPVEERQHNVRARDELNRTQPDMVDYPMLFPRERRVMGAGVVDYALGIGSNGHQQTFNYTLAGGVEVFGGDLQGSVYGRHSAGGLRQDIANIRWRYVLDDNPYLTSLQAGQIHTTGLHQHRITGFALSNEPIMPRRVYDNYVVDGTTTPESEVELYVNNRLVAYTQADELGYYRFDYLLNYGTVRLSTRIYKPSGEIVVQENQLQLPYTFLPRGTIAYNIQGGRANRTAATFESPGGYAIHGDVAYGVANGVTTMLGVEYLSGEMNPHYYTSVSARLLGQYLLNVDLVPGYFYRANSSVYFSSSRSVNASFAGFEGRSHYNPRGARHETVVNVNMPFFIRSFQSGLRFGAEHQDFDFGSTTSGRIDASIRFNRLQLRLNYRERLWRASERNSGFENGLATAAVTYNVMRSPDIATVLRGISVRVQADYHVQSMKVRNVSLQLSRSIARRGRLQIHAQQNLYSGVSSIRASLNIDLNPMRVASQYAARSNGYGDLQQNFTGSLLFDTKQNSILMANRRQVGHAAVSVMAFIDENGNGRHDQGEQKVPLNNMQLDQGAVAIAGKDTMLRLTQLQPYWKYNAMLTQGSISDPILVPLYTEFSFVTDPNRFKRLEIPLYRSGTISGYVLMANNETELGLGGVRLMLKDQKGKMVKTLRTFSDGSFFAMGVIPGTYHIEIDAVQLNFLDKYSSPRVKTLTVKPLADGDLVENIIFRLVDSPPSTEPRHPDVSEAKLKEGKD